MPVLKKRSAVEQLEFAWDESASPEPEVVARPKVVPRVSAVDAFEERKAFQHALASHCGIHVLLTITDNTTTMMSVKYDRLRTTARLRLHRMFLSAPPEVVRALALWVKSPRSRNGNGLLDAYIRANDHQILCRRGPARTETRGTHFDLRAIFDELNHRHFSGAVSAAITWGRMPEFRRRRSIRFGSYYPRENLIRVHPLLDQAFMPAYFVRYIVFHEMLHAFLGIEELPSGRQRIHTAAFKRLERAYPDYARAAAWQENPKNLSKLLSKRNCFTDFIGALAKWNGR
jgi:hypothetical protein